LKKYAPEQLRDIAVIAHGGAGKTTLTEAMLYLSGGTDRFGRVEDGTATTDFDEDEKKRKISISMAFAPVEWNGTKINIIDIPGFLDFVGEVHAGLRVADGAILMVDAVSGVEVGTEIVWRVAEDRKVPRLIAISRMDRENANFKGALASVTESFGQKACPVVLPIGFGEGFKGVVDVVTKKAYLYPDHTGKSMKEAPIPEELASEVEEYRGKLMEFAAETDEELLTKYMDTMELAQDEFEKGLVAAVSNCDLYPVVAVSGGKLVGVQQLLDAVVRLLPSSGASKPAQGKGLGEEVVVRKPAESEPLSAFVFKTTADPFVGKINVLRVMSGVLKPDATYYNITKDKSERFGSIFFLKGKQQIPAAEAGPGEIVAVAKLADTTTNDTFCDKDKPVKYEPTKFPKPVLSFAMKPKAKGDEEKIGSGLSRLTEEDPTIQYYKSPETSELIVSGMGDSHIDVIAERLKRKFGVDVTLDTPSIPYRETITRQVRVQGRHKKQTGGRGQFGDIWVRFAPLERGAGFQFIDEVFGGAVPRNFIPAVEKGLREELPHGRLAGYPMVDFSATLDDGSSHPVDSSEMAFKLAARLAIEKAWEEAGPILLEPIVRAEVLVPEEYMGDIMGDFNKKRGKILGMESQGRYQIVRALAPLAEMFKYSIDLRSMTGGRGTFTMEFDHYEEVPAHISAHIVEAARKAKEAARE